MAHQELSNEQIEATVNKIANQLGVRANALKATLLRFAIEWTQTHKYQISNYQQISESQSEPTRQTDCPPPSNSVEVLRAEIFDEEISLIAAYFSAYENARSLLTRDNFISDLRTKECKQILAEARKYNASVVRTLDLHEVSCESRGITSDKDGYRLVELLTTAALNAEGRAMGNCLASTSIRPDSHRRYFSFRDRANFPHATIMTHVATEVIWAGRSYTSAASPNDLSEVISTLLDREWELGSTSRTSLEDNQIPGADAYWPTLPTVLCVDHLPRIPISCRGVRPPRTLVVKDSLQETFVGWLTMPREMVIFRSWDARGLCHLSLPARLHVGGSLNLHNCHLSRLPERLYVGGTLELGGTGIRIMPRRWFVGGEVLITPTREKLGQVSSVSSKKILRWLGRIIGCALVIRSRLYWKTKWLAVFVRKKTNAAVRLWPLRRGAR